VTGRGALPTWSDPALSTTRELLDIHVMSRVLQRSLGPERAIDALRIHRIRYHPGERLLIHYRADVSGAVRDVVALLSARDLSSTPRRPRAHALVAKASGHSMARQPLTYEPDVRTLISWLPVDMKLPALAERPETIRQRLRGVGQVPADDEYLPLKYWARVRAAYATGRVVIKFYARPADLQRSVAGLRAASLAVGSSTAGYLAHLPDLGASVQQRLPGQPPADPLSVARAAGELLARLHHAAPEGLRLAPAVLETARTRSDLLRAVLPGLTERLRRLLDRLAHSEPTTPDLVAVHGDFYHEQLLLAEDGVRVIDLHGLAAGAAAGDFARYAARGIQHPSDLDDAWLMLDSLTDGYGRRPRHLAWNLASQLLASSIEPLRHASPDWPALVAGKVAAAEAALA